MKREIKFRAWDGEKMWYGGEIYSKSKDGNRSYPCEITSRGIEFIRPYDSKHSDIIIDEQGREGYQDWDIEKTNRDCEVMQFTGMKDKNGVDIYEGDICELEVEFQGVYNEYYEEPAFHHILTGVVKYMPSTGYYLSIFKAVDVDTGEDIYHPKRKEIVQYRTKLIGNIHQNKHLLK